MTKTITKTIITIMLIVCCMFMLSTNVEAASFSASASKTTLNVGGTLKITVKASNAAGMYKISISDTSILSISSGSASEFIENNSTSITLKAKKAGTVKVTASADDMTDLDDSTKKVTGSKTFTIKVTDTSQNNDNQNDNKDDNTTTKKSNNANLSTLGVTPKEYDFTGFNKDKTSYEVTIPNNVNSLNVSYKTADKNAKVKITGNKDLEVGTNDIKVVVTAEDGKTTKTYTIKATKLATEDEKPGNIIDDDKNEDLLLKKLEIEGLKLSPEFASNVYTYETTIQMDEKDLSEVKIIAEANNENATIEITGNTNLVEGENVINIIVKSKDSAEQKVYQITVNKVSSASEIVTPKSGLKKEYVIIGSFVLSVILILAVIIIKKIRDRKYDELEEDDDWEDTQVKEDNLSNNNMVEELFNKKKNGEELNKEEEEIIEDIENENDRIFNKPKEGTTVEYNQNEINEEKKEEFLEELRQNRKGKHF